MRHFGQSGAGPEAEIHRGGGVDPGRVENRQVDIILPDLSDSDLLRAAEYHPVGTRFPQTVDLRQVGGLDRARTMPRHNSS